jgi:hypothetical protein
MLQRKDEGLRRKYSWAQIEGRVSGRLERRSAESDVGTRRGRSLQHLQTVSERQTKRLGKLDRFPGAILYW